LAIGREEERRGKRGENEEGMTSLLQIGVLFGEERKKEKEKKKNEICNEL